MSTEIEDLCGGYGPHLLSADEDEVQISTCRTPRGRDVIAVTPTMDRADFIAAVELECDGIFIPRAELPAVKQEVPGFGPHYVLVKEGPIHESSFTYAYPNAPASSASWHRRTAEAHLALAEYLDAHPPVPDEVIANLCDRFASIDMPLTREQAIDLYRTGIRVEVAS